MHLWSTRKLADEIVAGQVPAREKLAYFVFAQVFYVALWYVTGYTTQNNSWLYIYEAVVVVFVTFAGAHKVASAYRKPVDGGFFEMAYLLSVPLLVKTTLAAWVALWGAYWLISTVVPHLPPAETDQSVQAFNFWIGRLWQVLPFLVAVTMAVVYWYRLAHHVAHVVAKS